MALSNAKDIVEKADHPPHQEEMDRLLRYIGILRDNIVLDSELMFRFKDDEEALKLAQKERDRIQLEALKALGRRKFHDSLLVFSRLQNKEDGYEGNIVTVSGLRCLELSDGVLILMEQLAAMLRKELDELICQSAEEIQIQIKSLVCKINVIRTLKRGEWSRSATRKLLAMRMKLVLDRRIKLSRKNEDWMIQIGKEYKTKLSDYLEAQEALFLEELKTLDSDHQLLKQNRDDTKEDGASIEASELPPAPFKRVDVPSGVKGKTGSGPTLPDGVGEVA